MLAVAAEESVSEVELLRDGRFRFPKAVVPFAVSSVAAEVISLSDDETEKEHVVDAKTVSSMAVKTKTAASDAPSRRWCILCEICRKACRNEAELSKHRAQAHVPQVCPSMNLWSKRGTRCTIKTESEGGKENRSRCKLRK